MYTVDEIVMNAPVDVCFRAGADVERWPEALPHYRWVRFQRKDGFGTGRVEMAAYRQFGPVRYPVWWVSEMAIDGGRPAVHYRHVAGITTGMEVVWSFKPVEGARTLVRIVHDWPAGPAWPLPAAARAGIADHIIGPLFVTVIAGRTLAGIQAKAERVHGAAARAGR